MPKMRSQHQPQQRKSDRQRRLETTHTAELRIFQVRIFQVLVSLVVVSAQMRRIAAGIDPVAHFSPAPAPTGQCSNIQAFRVPTFRPRALALHRKTTDLIRGSIPLLRFGPRAGGRSGAVFWGQTDSTPPENAPCCLLYTSDAA